MIKRLVKQVIAIGIGVLALLGCSATLQRHQLSDQQEAALAMFSERCKKAGEFIHRTATDVEGIFLLKVRPPGINYEDQFALTDPYGRDLAGQGGFIESFLRGSYRGDDKVDPSQRSRGYLYVDAIDPNDGVRYRYTGAVKDVVRTRSVMNGGDGKTQYTSREFVVERSVASGVVVPRYGVTYDDISTRQEREHWIAGSSLKVIDLHTNELMAERVGYMVDVFQGSRAGERSPWLLAADHACPSFGDRHGANRQAGQTDRFTEKVLKPLN